jgi:hypothetical protein
MHLYHDSQNPQCEGDNKNHILFSIRVPGRDPSFHDIKQKDGNFILKAGKAQGITDGAVFAMYADCIKSQFNSSRCTLHVATTEDLCATLKSPENATRYAFPKPAYAQQVCCRPDEEPRVHFMHTLTHVLTMKAVSRCMVAHSSDMQDPSRHTIPRHLRTVYHHYLFINTPLFLAALHRTQHYHTRMTLMDSFPHTSPSALLPLFTMMHYLGLGIITPYGCQWTCYQDTKTTPS